MDDNSNKLKAEIALRARYVINSYADFLKMLDLNPQFYRLDMIVLRAVIRRYLKDVDRLHTYHDMPRIDCRKIAGYYTYWFCKLKPIHIVDKRGAYQDCLDDNELTGVSKLSFFINELFSIHLGLGRINSHYSKSGSSTEILLDQKTYNTLLYSLKYRLISGDMLALTYEMVDVSVNKRTH